MSVSDPYSTTIPEVVIETSSEATDDDSRTTTVVALPDPEPTDPILPTDDVPVIVDIVTEAGPRTTTSTYDTPYQPSEPTLVKEADGTLTSESADSRDIVTKVTKIPTGETGVVVDARDGHQVIVTTGETPAQLPTQVMDYPYRPPINQHVVVPGSAPDVYVGQDTYGRTTIIPGIGEPIIIPPDPTLEDPLIIPIPALEGVGIEVRPYFGGFSRVIPYDAGGFLERTPPTPGEPFTTTFQLPDGSWYVRRDDPTEDGTVERIIPAWPYAGDFVTWFKEPDPTTGLNVYTTIKGRPYHPTHPTEVTTVIPKDPAPTAVTMTTIIPKVVHIDPIEITIVDDGGTPDPSDDIETKIKIDPIPYTLPNPYFNPYGHLDMDTVRPDGTIETDKWRPWAWTHEQIIPGGGPPEDRRDLTVKVTPYTDPYGGQNIIEVVEPNDPAEEEDDWWAKIAILRGFPVPGIPAPVAQGGGVPGTTTTFHHPYIYQGGGVPGGVPLWNPNIVINQIPNTPGNPYIVPYTVPVVPWGPPLPSDPPDPWFLGDPLTIPEGPSGDPPEISPNNTPIPDPQTGQAPEVNPAPDPWVGVLPPDPDWAQRVDVSYGWQVATSQSISGKEERDLLGGQLVRRINYRARLGEDDLQAYRYYLDSIGSEVWMVDWSQEICEFAVNGNTIVVSDDLTTLDVRTRFLVLWRSWRDYDVIAVSGWSGANVLLTLPTTAEGRLFPIRVGRYEDLGGINSINDQVGDIDLKWVEEPGNQLGDDVVRTVPTYEGRPFWNRRVDWSTRPTESFDDNVVSEALGFGASASRTERDYKERTFTQSHLLQREEMAAFYGFASAVSGRGQSFWMPSWHSNFTGKLEDYPVGTSVVDVHDISVDTQAKIRAGWKHIALISESGQTIEAMTIADINGSLITFERPSTISFQCMCQLHKVRLRSRLSVKYDSRETARFDIRSVELTHEYETDVALRKPLYLYEISSDSIGTQRFTSYDSDQLVALNQYYKASINHGDMILSGDLAQSSIKVQYAASDQNDPLLKALRDAEAETINISVYATTVDNPDTSDVLFVGTIDSAKEVALGKFDLKTSTLGRLKEGRLGRVLLQKPCNHHLGDRRCKINMEALRTSSTIISTGVSVEGLSWIEFATPATKTPDYYLIGHAKVEFIRRDIIAVEDMGSGRMRIYVCEPFTTSLVGKVIDLWPGCDRSYLQCIGRHNNSINFGGVPHLPDNNPSLQAIRVTAPAPNIGKK